MLAFLAVTGLFSLALALTLKGVDGLGFAIGAALGTGVVAASGAFGGGEAWVWIAIVLSPSFAVALAKLFWESVDFSTWKSR